MLTSGKATVGIYDIAASVVGDTPCRAVAGVQHFFPAYPAGGKQTLQLPVSVQFLPGCSELSRVTRKASDKHRKGIKAFTAGKQFAQQAGKLLQVGEIVPVHIQPDCHGNSLIQLHNGAIRVYSKPDEGSTFVIRIPLIYRNR